MGYADPDSPKRDFLRPVHIPVVWSGYRVNRSFAIPGLGSGMTRILILLAILALGLAAIGAGAPGVAPPADATAAPAGLSLAPSLDPISLGIGVLAGLVIGWIWGLPWRNTREMFREVAFRSLRSFMLMGVTMGAAAILLFF